MLFRFYWLIDSHNDCGIKGRDEGKRTYPESTFWRRANWKTWFIRVQFRLRLISLSVDCSYIIVIRFHYCRYSSTITTFGALHRLILSSPSWQQFMTVRVILPKAWFPSNAKRATQGPGVQFLPFISLHQRYGTPYLLTFCNLKLLILLDVI